MGVVVDPTLILIGSFNLAESTTKSMENKNYTDNELTLVQKSAIFICPLH